MFCTLIPGYPFQQSMLCGIPCYNYEHHGFNKASIDTYCTKIDCHRHPRLTVFSSDQSPP